MGSSSWNAENTIEEKTASTLDQELRAYLQQNEYSSITKDLEELAFSFTNNLKDASLKEQAVFKTLENLNKQGKLDENEYKKLQQLVLQSLALLGKDNNLVTDEIVQESDILEQNLMGILSNEDFSKINDDLEILKKHILSNSEKSLEHEQKLMNELSDIYSAGKLTNDEYEKVKKSVEQSIALSKQENKSVNVDVLVTDTSSKQKPSRTTESPINFYIKEQPSQSALRKNCTQDMVTDDHSYMDIILSSTTVPPKEIFLHSNSGWRPSSN